MAKTASAARQAWLEHATMLLRRLFKQNGYTVPDNVRVSIGFPKSRRKAIGQCWGTEASSDTHFEIFVSPLIPASDPINILAVLAHELAHATVGIKAGHKKPFANCVYAIGLEGKPKSTVAGEAFKAWAVDAINGKLGQYPAGSLSEEAGEKKQGTRLIKAECQECGYTVRLARKWLDEKGAPHCPEHGAMYVEGFDAGEGEEGGEE